MRLGATGKTRVEGCRRRKKVEWVHSCKNTEKKGSREILERKLEDIVERLSSFTLSILLWKKIKQRECQQDYCQVSGKYFHLSQPFTETLVEGYWYFGGCDFGR